MVQVAWLNYWAAAAGLRGAAAVATLKTASPFFCDNCRSVSHQRLLRLSGFVVFNGRGHRRVVRGLSTSETTVPSELLGGVSCQYGCCQTDKAERQIIRLWLEILGKGGRTGHCTQIALLFQGAAGKTRRGCFAQVVKLNGEVVDLNRGKSCTYSHPQLWKCMLLISNLC